MFYSQCMAKCSTAHQHDYKRILQVTLTALCPKADQHISVIMLEQRGRCSSGSSIPRRLIFFNCLTMKTEASDSSKTLITMSIYQSTWCNIPQSWIFINTAVTTSNFTTENCCHVWYLQRESKTHIKRFAPEGWLTYSHWDEYLHSTVTTYETNISQLNNVAIYCNNQNLKFWG